MTDIPPTSRVSGNLVIICLTIITLVMIGILATLVILNRPVGTWLQVVIPTLAALIPLLANLFKSMDLGRDVQQVKTQTNGTSDRMLTIIEQQAQMLSQSSPPPPAQTPPPDPPAGG